MAEPSIKDLAYRTAAGVFGGPVDLATMVMRPFGYKTPDEQVFGSSEYIGKKLEDVGLVSSARAPITEFLTSMAVPTPGGIAKGAALAAPMIGGMFVGKGARTWDALAAQKAKMLADMGTDPRTIWQQTGTWKGSDGKWRQEIDKSGAQIINLPPSQTITKVPIESQRTALLNKDKTQTGTALQDMSRGAVSPMGELAPISRRPTLVDPNALVFRESVQDRKAGLTGDTDEFDPIVVIDNSGTLSILDGHNRASVAKDRGDSLASVKITQDEYDALQTQGFEDGEIAWAALQRADQSYAADNLDSQFPGADIRRGGDKAWDALIDMGM